MKIIAINGSPRKGWNTHLLLESALEGARSAGAETEIINLYDMSFKGCVSCFACKRRGVTVDKCAFRDELTPVLEAVHNCDGLVLGTPIYLSSETGMMRSFMERLIFPYLSYDGAPTSFGREIRNAYIYTMNAPLEAAESMYRPRFDGNKAMLERIIGPSDMLVSAETLQFANYDDYAASRANAQARIERRETVFPLEIKKAFELGEWIVSGK